MFFILSKTIGYLTRPLILVALMALAGWLLKNPVWKKRLLTSALVLLLVLSNSFLSNEVLKLVESPLVPLASITKTYEWGIMLTGVTSDKKELLDRVYVSGSPDRVNHTVLLYKKGIIKKILISGGSGRITGDAYSEARALVAVYTSMGVDPAHIAVEGDSRNTHESAVAVAAMLKGTDPATCLLITSASHMPRSIGCFRNEGFDCDVFPTDQKSGLREFYPDNLLFPSADAMVKWDIVFKELSGLLMYRLAGYL
ncbi:MAG: YdcF family protein [Bacteroidota bacterium]